MDAAEACLYLGMQLPVLKPCLACRVEAATACLPLHKFEAFDGMPAPMLDFCMAC